MATIKLERLKKACQIYARMTGNVETSDVDMYFRIDDDGNSKEPNVFTYGALVDVQGCEPNHIVYDALIDGFCKAGKLDDAQEVFAKMSECGYSPNVYTYSSLIDRLFKDKRLDLALKVLSKMLENSCAPNVVIYTEMIDGLCRVGKTDEAYKLMLMMEEKGCYPNVVTYTAMIDGFGNVGKVEKCLELLREMGSKGCAPNFVTYRVLLNHCCATGLLDEAHNLLDEMKQTYWPRHISGYRKVIEGFNREFIISLGLLNEISENDSVPIVSVYRILIDSFIKAGKLESALELHEEIRLSFPLTAASKNMYISLIESLSRASKVDKAFELYTEMVRRGGVAELSTFVLLIKGLININNCQITYVRWFEHFPSECNDESVFGGSVIPASFWDVIGKLGLACKGCPLGSTRRDILQKLGFCAYLLFFLKADVTRIHFMLQIAFATGSVSLKLQAFEWR
ncbi:pentatricopeptide repeat-containing protein At1g06710, mitochondrial-like [Fagus crenata]